MPDPAVDAARLGLPYTEPNSRSHSRKKSQKVRFEMIVDPSDPSAPPRPRRVLEKKSGSGFGLLDRIRWGNEPDLPTTRPIGTSGRPLPQLGATTNKHFAAQGLAAHDPTPSALPPNLEAHIVPHSFPPDFAYLPRNEKRYLERMHREELRGIKAIHEGTRMAEKAKKEEMKWLEKEKKRREKEEEKRLKREEKWHRKHPFRSLPIPSKPGPATPTAAPPPATVQPTGWMMLPTHEEFGIRRPFDSPGRPAGLGGPVRAPEWPMMSRTMSHAITDMAREERVHLVNGGRLWTPTV
ncbi:hypothetical protein BCR39DRAFT_585760 [Naematelia encephala]|uniref:Uncharacterized protein n=1 Tax=Naematelia encephala TaxID=71784 RepID=A0A1Y2BJ48_9TREE|nr:hypothetical protein BCR39DRAFT_585760 [Naematelia encephala]